MKFKSIDHFFTGVATPVAALRSKESCGIGEFPDLLLLADWCQKIGLEIIQILPVNDTGFQSSPYNALSTFALHPIYLRIQMIPEFKDNPEYIDDLDSIKVTFNEQKRVIFSRLLKAKLQLLLKIFKFTFTSIQSDHNMRIWIQENDWIKPYAVYNLLKRKYHDKHWKDWGELNTPGRSSIDEYWKNNLEDCYFYAWLQYLLQAQLINVALALESKGIFLKGDIPILMNEDSVDLWYNRKYFDSSMNAGAPPDMFALGGQNWGFPVYNWHELEHNDYDWWRKRLKQADKFYHAYRIDHVLGFFRIWQIHSSDFTGSLGYYDPYDHITIEELTTLGYDKGRIRWMSLPHIHGWDIHFRNPDHSEILKDKYLIRIGNEDLYNLSPDITGERYIHNLEENREIKDFLLSWYRNRTLIRIKEKLYQRLWSYSNTKAFKSLDFDEKLKLEKLFKAKEKKSEKLWAEQGNKLLSMMQETTDMLMCAEDLGVVPECVPVVLGKLNILSLKIERWTRDYSRPDHSYIDIKKYPRLSVCIPSVHDTTTLRGWWEEELSRSEKEVYYNLLKLKEECPESYTLKVAQAIIRRNLDSNSIITIFQIQDLLFLDDKLDRKLFNDDRINVPGIVTDSNWTYRIPVTIESMINNDKFNQSLGKMVEKRRQKKIINNKK